MEIYLRILEQRLARLERIKAQHWEGLNEIGRNMLTRAITCTQQDIFDARVVGGA